MGNAQLQQVTLSNEYQEAVIFTTSKAVAQMNSNSLGKGNPLQLPLPAYDDRELAKAAANGRNVFVGVGDPEFKGQWARCWADLGSGDALGVDCLLHALARLSRERLALSRTIIGGLGHFADWEVPESRP